MFKMAKNWSGMWSLPGMPSIPFPSSLSFLSLRPGSPFPFNAISSITHPSACRLVILGHWVILQLGSQGFGGRTYWMRIVNRPMCVDELFEGFLLKFRISDFSRNFPSASIRV